MSGPAKCRSRLAKCSQLLERVPELVSEPPVRFVSSRSSPVTATRRRHRTTQPARHRPHYPDRALLRPPARAATRPQRLPTPQHARRRGRSLTPFSVRNLSRPQQELCRMIRDLLAEGAQRGEFRDDVAPDELPPCPRSSRQPAVQGRGPPARHGHVGRAAPSSLTHASGATGAAAGERCRRSAAPASVAATLPLRARR